MKSLLLLLPLVAVADAAPVNPHGSPTGCIECHATAPDGVSIGVPLPIVATCRGCHPTADMHPVGMPPDEVRVQKGWPLEDGKVTCATCHAEPAHGGEAAALEAPWHRGGPYARVEELCYQCHDRAAYTRSDPHHPAVMRSFEDPTCAACHTGPPAQGASLADSRLRAGAEEACLSCHVGPIHTGLVDHMGKVVPEAQRASIAATLPLDAEGRIGCWTCHDAHQTEASSVAPDFDGRLVTQLVHQAIRDDWKLALAPDALRLPGQAPVEHPTLLALPASDGTLCLACHVELP